MIKIYILVYTALLAVFFLGMACAYWKMNRKPDGIFRVNTVDPDKDVFSVEIHIPLAELPTKKTLYFKVVNEGSQEKPLP